MWDGFTVTMGSLIFCLLMVGALGPILSIRIPSIRRWLQKLSTNKLDTIVHYANQYGIDTSDLRETAKMLSHFENKLKEVKSWLKDYKCRLTFVKGLKKEINDSGSAISLLSEEPKLCHLIFEMADLKKEYQSRFAFMDGMHSKNAGTHLHTFFSKMTDSKEDEETLPLYNKQLITQKIFSYAGI